MPNIAYKIALPIILTGLFIVTVFVALNYNSLDANFYIVFSIVVIYVFLFGFAAGQNFVSPLKKILQRADELIKGNLSSRVYLESKDELGELAKAFNELAEKLEENKSAIETAEKGVDIKVRARTESLEEIINALEQKVKNRTLELERMMGDSKKLQEEAKSKEAEISELKRQIGSLKPKKTTKKNKDAGTP